MIEYGEASPEDIDSRLAELGPGYHRAAGIRHMLRYLKVGDTSSLKRAQEHARLGTLVDTATAAFDARGPLPYKQGKAAGKPSVRGKRSVKANKKRVRHRP